MINRTILACVALLSTVVAAGTPLRAQGIGDSFAGFSKSNNNDPIDIEADSLEVLDDKKYAIFTGDVKATQGKFRLIAKQIKVTYTGGLATPQQQKKSSTQNGIKTIEASGKVAITTPDGQSATSDWATYDVLTKSVTISGNVVLSQGGNVMHGDKLIVDLTTGRSRFDAKAETEGKRPRISGVFMPGKMKPPAKEGAASEPESTAAAAASSPPPLPEQRKDAMDGN